MKVSHQEENFNRVFSTRTDVPRNYENLNRMVWSMDSNSKFELWFSPYSVARGDKLCGFISTNNLFIINENCRLTFHASQGTSYVDVTVVVSDLLQDISSWRPSENESLSDHVMLKFEFCLPTVLQDTSSVPFVIFNTNKENCDQYGFTPQKSTEDALIRLNEIVQREIVVSSGHEKVPTRGKPGEENHEERGSKDHAASTCGPHSDSFNDTSRRRRSNCFTNNFQTP
ncbi:hypothetical protein TNCV_49431 [Trichonephila clavipes]|nr:hypothetical protein TNCV_49431 [Trichonephila clavipes]